METINETQTKASRRILEGQHAALKGLLRELGAQFADRGDEHGDDGRSLARSRIRELQRLLSTHLAYEESSGFLEQASQQAPRLARVTDELLRDHVALRKEVRALVRASEAAGEAPHRWRTLAVEFRRFAQHLGDHERAEYEVMQQAYFDDVGGSG